MASPFSGAHWIWCARNDPHAYNQTVCFRRTFSTRQPEQAVLRITADSAYRLYVNGTWVEDGPARAWPEHYQYDELDVTNLLRDGENRIEVTARYFGVGTMHQIPRQGGLIARIDLTRRGRTESIVTDREWEASPSFGHEPRTPKVGIQMEPVEEYDARLAAVSDFQPAVEQYAATRGPWKDLVPRKTPALTRRPRKPSSFREALRVRRGRPRHCVPVAQLANPGVIESNRNSGTPVILASVLEVRRKTRYDFTSDHWQTVVNGKRLKTGKVTLQPGRHAVVFFSRTLCESGHEKEFPFPFLYPEHARWRAPDPDAPERTWLLAVVADCRIVETDMIWADFCHPEVEQAEKRWAEKSASIATACRNPESLVPALAAHLRDVEDDEIFFGDFTAEFQERDPLGSAARSVDRGGAVCRGGQGRTVLRPPRGADLELCYDMGEETCGYFEFTVKADEGVILDLHAVEYIRDDGVIQHTHANRNGVRYVTKKGVNRFISLKRRAGRYLFLTIRNQHAAVELRRLRVIESTAPVEPVAVFRSDDPQLDRIHAVAERTLKLCMEDTFTDCPLYEQVYWVGDGRNEALYAYATYGDTAVSRNGLELGAESLERFPITGCQIPSSWTVLLPAWSFLWGMQVWEYYAYTGDRRFLKRLWPAVLENLEGAHGYLDEHGLFSAAHWNLLEWAPIDDGHRTVLHNSMLMVGAYDAAIRCAGALNDDRARRRLKRRRNALARAVNAWWDETRNSYPDSVHEDGTPSPKISQHTSMLAIMCDVIPDEHREQALENLLHPPRGMTRIGSPFALQFYYEALEKCGRYEAILKGIREQFGPMIEQGATTLWETFANSTCSPEGFPTRSHCHAWSASPLYFLNRIALGIRPEGVGSRAFTVSPWIGGLEKAQGATATPHGPVRVSWKRRGETLRIRIDAPENIDIRFVPNQSMDGLEVEIDR
ncbi:MGH1-like glycoside hydrolase domain-containing protein [Kiritimatiella glycovorans]|uniref:Alpha-L-rhamnosidase n=1 Tax=Kiritimatiella glycovorans TaxID=1307763 RepID=A0A0G3EGG0_9BACT|nr:alpha-L-rhamnosidase N-terminal domain-containing protein [Kiritimatiella glycovorans]AKJ65556.1 Alpha-L-rhamnosidase [Kiritimatiella glycovorans]